MFIIPTYYKAIDGMSKVQSQIAAGNTLIGTSATIAGARMERAFMAIGERSMAIGRSALGVGVALTLPLGLAAHAAMNFEKEMGNVATLMDTSTESLNYFNEGVLRLAKMPASKPLADLTESLYQIRSEGYKGAEAMDILKESTILSVTGLSTATEASKSMATAIRIFGKEGLTTSQIADIFFKTVSAGRTKMEAINESFGETAALVANAGVTFAEFQAATAALTNAGLTASTAQTSLSTAIMSLIKPSETMVELLQKMGYTGTHAGEQLIKNAGGMGAAFDELAIAAEKAHINIAKAYRNKEGFASVTLLGNGVKQQFQEDLAMMRNGANLIENAYAKQSATSAASWERLKNNVQVLGIRIGTILLPAVISLTENIIAIAAPLSRWAQKHKILAGIIFKTAAYIGVLSLSISAGAFLIGGITKAIWLWRGALVAYNYVVGFSGVLTGRFTMAMYQNAQMMAGAALATNGWRAALVGVLTTTNLIVAGLAAIFIYRNKIQNLANDSGAGRAYNYAIGDYQAVKESLERKYIQNPEEAQKYVRDNPKYNSPAIQRAFANIDSGEGNDDANDEIMQEKQMRESVKNINHHFTIDLRNDGKTVKMLNSADMMPQTSSTSTYND